jgi:flagellar biosynthesis protein FliR
MIMLCLWALLVRSFSHYAIMYLHKSAQHLPKESDTPAKTQSYALTLHGTLSSVFVSGVGEMAPVTHSAPPRIQMTSGNAIVCFCS